MNRIFDPAEPIDLTFEAETTVQSPAEPDAALKMLEPGSPIRELPEQPQEAATPAAVSAASTLRVPARSGNRQARRPATKSPPRTKPSRRRPDDRILLISALAGVCTVSVAGSLIYFGTWNRMQQSLSQERNLLLVERLRSLGPANPAPIQPPQTATVNPNNGTANTSSSADGSGLPPPPDEPWIQQLSSLPSPAPSSSPVLRVPLSPRLNAPAPAASASRAAPAPARSSGPLPQLVGIVGRPGKASSAIFLISGNSLNVSPGETIGGSGWRLRSADGETALIERDGELRQVSIANGNGL